MPEAAKCALHAESEFNLAVWKKQFSCGAKRNNLALQLVVKICSNYYQSITNDYLSKLCGLSESRFRALFREVVGKSPISYRNELRIEKAKKCLEVNLLQ